MIIDVDMYQKIREMSTSQGMSQRSIAKALGISRNTVKNTATAIASLGNAKNISVRQMY